MKTIFAALLLATAFITTPGAIADCYDDPTATFEDACIGQHESSDGDCPGGSAGYQDTGTAAYVYDADSPYTQASASVQEFCYHQSDRNHGTSSTQYASAYSGAAGDVRAGRYAGNDTSSGQSGDHSGEYAGVGVLPTNSYVGAGHYEQNGRHGHACVIYVIHNIGGWSSVEIPC